MVLAPRAAVLGKAAGGVSMVMVMLKGELRKSLKETWNAVFIIAFHIIALFSYS